MPELDYEQCQARAMHRMEMASSAAQANAHEAAERLTKDAQTFALLSIGAALQQLTKVMQGGH